MHGIQPGMLNVMPQEYYTRGMSLQRMEGWIRRVEWNMHYLGYFE